MRSGILLKLWSFLFVIGCVAQIWTAQAQTEPSSIYRIMIDETVERGLSAYVKRGVREAEEANADAILMVVNTPGGRLDAALEIKDTLLNSKVPVWALVDRQALSAGALITIAANEIYMVDGAVMGAATPIQGEGGAKASEKVVSAVRKAFAATAESRGRKPSVAEAMVDEDVNIEGLVEKGKLLTLTAEEAKAWGYAEEIVEGEKALLALKNAEQAEVASIKASLAEELVRFLTNPALSSLLISLGFLGLLFELKTAGWGLGGTIGLISLALFFWSHHIAGLAGWEGMALVVLGIVLMALEVFVVPGFGLAGILGMVSFMGGLFMSLIGDFSFATPGDLINAGYVLLSSIVLMVLGAWGMLTYLPGRIGPKGLMLSERLDHYHKDVSPEQAEQESQLKVGVQGRTITDLRPEGTASFAGFKETVVAEGQFIRSGTEVEIIGREGFRWIVRPVDKS